MKSHKLWIAAGVIVSLAAGPAALAGDRPILEFFQKAKAAKEARVAGDAPGEKNITLMHGGVRRFYHVHLPPSYDGRKPVPVVVVLHGGGGTWQGARNGSQMNLSSNAHGFIAVYPNSDSTKRWNIGERNQKKVQSNTDDIGFFRAMLDDLEKRFSVDGNRVYFTGLSNGGFMSYRVAGELSDRVAAVAPVSCALSFSDIPTDGRKISVMHIHGTADDWIPYNGGVVKTLGDPVPPVEATVGFWRKRNQCSEPVESFRNGQTVCVTSACAEGSEVVFCSVAGGGHVWPGGEYESDKRWYKKAVGFLSHDLTAHEEIWKFFEKHALAK